MTKYRPPVADVDPTGRSSQPAITDYLGSPSHLIAATADVVYFLLPHFLRFHAAWLYLVGAIPIYALIVVGTTAWLASRERVVAATPLDQRHFVYLHRDRIREALEGIGESFSDTTFTRTRTVEGNLNLTLPHLPTGGGLRRQTEDQITRTIQQGGRSGYRLLEQYLHIQQIPDLERSTIADTIWSVPLETRYVESNPQKSETYLLGHVHHLNVEAWVRLDDVFCDEHPVGARGSRFEVVGWVQIEEFSITSQLVLTHPPTVRLRPLAIRLMA